MTNEEKDTVDRMRRGHIDGVACLEVTIGKKNLEDLSSVRAHNKIMSCLYVEVIVLIIKLKAFCSSLRTGGTKQMRDFVWLLISNALKLLLHKGCVHICLHTCA